MFFLRGALEKLSRKKEHKKNKQKTVQPLLEKKINPWRARERDKG